MSLSSNKSDKIIMDFAEIGTLLTRFRSTRSIAEVIILNKSYEGIITSVSDVTLSINCKGVVPPSATFIEIHIPSGHNIYTFRSSILDIQESEIIISTPTEIKSLIKRKYKRVSIDNGDEASIQFTIASGSTPSGDSTKVVPKYAKIYEELNKKVPNIKNIIQLVSAQLKTYSDDCHIHLHKKDEKYPAAVEIVKTLNESLYIKNIREKSTYLTAIMPKVVSLGTYLKYLKDIGKDANEVRDFMLRMISEDQKRGVRAYIYSPISLFGEVIGHLYVANAKTEFTDQNVYITISLTEIISEAFVKTKLFQLESAGAIEGKIINLSAGGALIEINDQYVMKFIHPPYTKLNVKLSLRDVTGKKHLFDCSGKVLRILSNEQKNRIAVKFLELRWNEHDTIDKAVRKKMEFKEALNNESEK